MTVFEVLTEVISPEELFGLVAFAKLVYVGQMVYSAFPVWLGMIWELFAAVSAGILKWDVEPLRLCGCRGMKRCLVAGYCGTGP